MTETETTSEKTSQEETNEETPIADCIQADPICPISMPG